MFLLTLDARLVCVHKLGVVTNLATQDFVTVHGRPVLVDDNPESRRIDGCPNYGVLIKPCTTTLPVKHGYSDLVWIGGRRACLSTVTGLTDGTPPGAVFYHVESSGQDLVKEEP